MTEHKTGFFYDELTMWHDAGNRGMFDGSGLYFQPTPSYENPETKRRLKNLLEVSGVMEGLVRYTVEPASEEDLLRVHDATYIERLARESKIGPGDAGVENSLGDGAPFAQGGFEIATVSAGLAKSAVEKVMTGEIKNAYSLSRPPGHHAKKAEGCGFCILANIPIAIKAAKSKKLLNRVVVIDWDVHHGNGTQEAFYEDSEVLTISIHHDNNYPVNSGAVEERGEGEGFGYNLNIPLPAGSGIGTYEATLDQLVIPALERFKPDLIIVACGYDSSALDPLGPMLLDSESYRMMMQKVMDTADGLCEGRIVVVHEGGYSEAYVPFCGLALIEALSQQTSEIHDYMGDEIRLWGQQSLQAHQQTLIDSIIPYLEDI